MPPPRFAAIDVGSNTVKLVVAERGTDGSFAAIYEAAHAVRLGRGIQSCRLTESAMERTVEALREFSDICEDAGVEAVAAVGTSALRDAENRDDFIRRARDVGVPLEAIPGEEEARLSFMAVRGDPLWREAEALIVMDIGGGSTEVIVGGRSDILSRKSLRIGAVRLTESALHGDPPTMEEVEAAGASVADALKGLSIPTANYAAVGVGGTMTNMGRVALQMAVTDLEILHGTTLTIAEVDRQIEMYAGLPVQERRSIVGLDPERADIILGGAIIVRAAMAVEHADSIRVSTRGLRWGLLYDRFG